jgi:hypothetical protein
MAVTVTLKQSLKLVEVARGGKVFTSGKVYNMPHYKAVESRFKAWDRLGWPYEPKDIEEINQ